MNSHVQLCSCDLKLASMERGIKMKNILVYGTGKYYEQNKDYLKNNYKINAFIDTYRDGVIDEIPIIRPIEIEKYQYEDIYIMVQNLDILFQMINNLKKVMPKVKKVRCPYFEQMDGFTFNKGTQLRILENFRVEMEYDAIRIDINSFDEYNNVYEIFHDGSYNYCLNNNKPDVVIDIGMNIGAAALFFLSTKKVEKVYGFEPFKRTYKFAEENICKNNIKVDKYEIMNVGIGTCCEKRRIEYVAEMSCALSSLNDNNIFAINQYEEWGLVNKNNDRFVEEIEIIDAKVKFNEIFSKHHNCNIVLKIDCEGEEYGILNELYKYNLLKRIDVIMMEWHYRGSEYLTQILDKAGYSYWCFSKSNHLGLIYALNFHRIDI